MKIDVVTYAVGKNGVAYAEFCGDMLRRFSTGQNCISYYCIGDQARGWMRVLSTARDPLSNSMTHGMALNEAFNICEGNSDILLVVDADCAVVYPKWDDVVIAETKKVDFWGWQIPAGSKRGAPNFPCIFFIAWRRQAMMPPMLMDFRPLVPAGQERVARIVVESEPNGTAKAYETGPNNILKCDTGYRLPFFAYKAGRSSGVIQYVRQDCPLRQLPYVSEEQRKLCMQKPTHMAEWHYNGKLFGTHKQACRNHPLTEGWGLAWKQRIEAYIENNSSVGNA